MPTYEEQVEKLKQLKSAGDAPEFLNIEGYITLSSGYLVADETPKAMYSRVAKAASSYYKNPKMWEKKFFDVMWKNWLCPSSPILSNMGTKRGMPISCNSLSIADSLDSIFMKNYELAILSKNGAGVGIYLGDIRGRGTSIKGNGASEGIVPWCKVIDQTTVSVSQGCYDDKTELLTEFGWQKFSDLQMNTKIAQVNDTGTMSFTNFTDYICYDVSEDLCRFTNKTGSIDLLTTKNHRMAFEKRKRVSNKRNSDGKITNHDEYLTGKLDIMEADKFKCHRDIRFWITARNAYGAKETLSALDQFLIAYQADGSTNPISSSTDRISNTLIYCFHFLKERKIKRIKEILDKLNWHYTENMQNDQTTNILVRVPLDIKVSKKLSDVFNITQFSASYAKEFISEIAHWDGSINHNDNISYSCVIEENVDFVQAVSFIAGRMSTLGTPTKKEEHHQMRYFVYICQRDNVDGEDITKTEEYYSGKVYCATVPTGLLVVRRNGAVAICGNSTRRGASAVYLPIEHGDINEFLNIRRPTGDVNRRCLNLNHGICITDVWMQDMLAGNKEKRLLWQEVLKNRVETGEPYLFFTDNVNSVNPKCYTDNDLSVKTSNICSEITLHTDPDHTFVCCLSSLNLVKWEEWKDTDLVNTTVRFLDAVLEEYIQKTETVKGMEASRASAIKGRAIGIGVLGWHTLLQSKMVPFDSFDAMTINAQIFSSIRKKSDEETEIMAKELGEPEWCKGHNRRHTHCIAVAPTVSNSIISGGYSAGIEPITANIYSQKSAKGTFIRKNPILEDLLKSKNKDTVEIWRTINEYGGSVQTLDCLSDQEKQVFLTARELNQHAIIKQAAQRQRWIDQAQSVNLFFASNSSPKYIHEVHIAAWENKLKTLYYLRTEGVIRGDMASRSKEECSACEG